MPDTAADSAPRYAVTQIQPPRPRAALLPRPALQAALMAACRSHRVVLLQAAAGFGKTSALGALVATAQAAGVATAWVSVDRDDDAERLFACLVGALEPLDLPWRVSPGALVQWAGGDAASRQRAATALLNALAASGVEQGVVVVDDLHRLQAAGAADLLDALVERLPDRWTFALASRTPPALALARWRARGELAEFTQDELRFSARETQALLQRQVVAAVAAEGSADLHSRTAGWPAGLTLALAALRARPGGGAGGRQLIDRHLYDYLAAEVLDGLPPPLHDFLLRCAVLPELTVTRAAAVSGDDRAAERMDEIERRGLFATALQSHERTLVLHDLFRDALLRRQAQLLPGEMSALLQRAAAGEPDPVRRVGYLLRAGDWTGAESALVAAADALFLHGGAGDVLRLVEQFPPPQRSARLACLAGAASGLRWEWNDMVHWYRHAVAAAQPADADVRRHAQARLAYALYPIDRNDEAESLIAALAAEPLAPATRAPWLMADAMQQFRRGEHGRLRTTYAEVLAILDRSDLLLRWWECAPPFNWSTIAGMPALIGRYLSGALPRLAERPLPMRGELRLLQAVQRLWAGDVAGAGQALAAAEDDIRWLAVSGELEVGAGIVRAIVDAVHGRGDAVQQRLQALAAREDERPVERRLLWRHQIAVYGVRLSDTLGDAGALQAWAAQLKENPLHDPGAQNARAVAARARHAAARGRWDEAAALFDGLQPKLAVMDVNGQRTDLTLRHAHALLKAQRMADAARALAPALDRLRAEGVRGQALLSGPALLQALAATRWGALLDGAQQAELAAAAALAASLRAGTAVQLAAPATPDDGLSAREREVLERVAAGDSNKVIARTLEISPHTVKRHVANILDKLGLATRGQAAAWLRDPRRG